MQASSASSSCNCCFRDCISSAACNSFSCSRFVSASTSTYSLSPFCCSSEICLSTRGLSYCCCSPQMGGLSSLWLRWSCNSYFSSSFSSCSLALWLLSTCLTMANSFVDYLSCSSRWPMSTTPLELAILIQVWVLSLSSSSAKKCGTTNFWGIIFPTSNKL